MYLNKVSGLIPTGSAQSCTTAAPTDIAVFLAPNQVIIKRVGFVIKTAMTVTAAVISVYKRPKASTNTNQVLITTLTIPVAQAIGSYVYKDITGYAIPAGYELAFVCTTAATAGDGWCLASEVEDAPEVALNLSTMVASA